MRLLYLQQLLVLPQCPGNPRCFEFARYWTEAGHEVHFVSSTAGIPPDHPVWQSRQPDGSYRYQGIYIHFLSVDYDHLWSFPQRLRAFWRFYRLAWRQRHNLNGFDVVLAYSAPLSVGELGRRLSDYLHIPFVFEVADVWPDVPIEMGIIPPGPWRGWLYRRTNQMYAAARHICAFSEGMQQQIARHGVPLPKISVIHNGVDTRQIAFQERETHDTIELIYTGTVGIANDLMQIVQAAERIEALGERQIRFTIIGSGNDAPRIQAYLREHPLAHLRWLGQSSKEAAAAMLRQADIGLSCFAPYPVLQANSATKFYDYLAAGLPVVINYQGWQADYLREYNCGLSAPQGDTAALVEQILQLSHNAELRQQMGRNGRRLAEERFDREMLADKMLQILMGRAVTDK